ncbi:hypothetical protein J4421_04285 [Candidatus Woesearchaeota archaeon]|nr:hypothetical protein [Candidatus Woesearchaeota archaeon]
MRVLGIHDGHNASVCLIEDGKIRFAIQEERLVYEKNKGGFPHKSIARLFEVTNFLAKDIDKVAVASEHTSVVFAADEYFERQRKGSLQRNLEHLAKKTPFYAFYKSQRRKDRVKNLTALGFAEKDIFFVDHHLCHAATAYFGSHFPRDEKILVLTNDGAGDGLCATVSIGQNNTLTRLTEIKSENSLAGIYCLTTQLLGFKPLEHEYKLMGMAPYASPSAEEKGYALFKDLVTISSENKLHFSHTGKSISLLLPVLKKRFHFQRFDTICAGLQKFTEEVLVQWAKNCLQETGVRKMALAGGIFMNVKVNKKIMELPEVEDLFIFPSCGDETVSIGAAYQVYNDLHGNSPFVESLPHFYLGDSFTNVAVVEELQTRKECKNFSFKKVKNIEKELARLLAAGKVVARCKGPMEFGARALGNRSILADPSNLRCVREINMMVKKRDFWMPFAPVILAEKQHDYLVNPKNVKAPYMILTFDAIKPEQFIAAVHQADLTARPQVITEEMNPEYYQILKEFSSLTGRGVLLNTSFNLHGFPIVHGPKEALDVFFKSDLKYLALGDYLVEKN